MLKLPEPLPYDYVDELIESQIELEHCVLYDWRYGMNVKRFSAKSKTETGRSTYPRDIFEIMMDCDEDEIDV